MIDLKQQAAAYIAKIGIKAASEKFGVQEQTVRMWGNTGKYPLPVLQEILNDAPYSSPEGAVEELQAPPQRSNEHSGMETADDNNDIKRLNDMEFRLRGTEQGIAQILGLLQGAKSPSGPQPDAQGNLPPYVGVNTSDSATDNLTRPSRGAAAPLSKEQLDKLDPNRNKPAVDVDTLQKGHWMRPKTVARS